MITSSYVVVTIVVMACEFEMNEILHIRSE